MSFQEREEIGYKGIITIQAGYLFQLDLDDLLFILEEHVSDESLCHVEILYTVCKILLLIFTYKNLLFINRATHIKVTDEAARIRYGRIYPNGVENSSGKNIVIWFDGAPPFR